MLLRVPFLLAPLALSTFIGAAHAQAPVTADTVVATVNGVEITAGHLVLMRSQLPQQYQQLPDSALFDGLLDQAVQQQLLAAEAGELDRASRLMLENQDRNLRANAAVTRLFDAELTEEAIQAAYDARFADAEPGTEFNAAHILVETEEDAAAIKAELDGGADFAELAQEKSTGPSGPNGGDLGWFGPGMMVPAFEEAVMALEPGAVSGPVETQFGWHVIRLNETRNAEVPALDDVRDEIVQELQAELLSERLDVLEAEAAITRAPAEEIAPDFLSDRNLLAD
ncbi:peptidylprolyl isomerase [Meridianimarinicoccus sp. RP-17]|uniref:peptidylprolyl isomerase n=1 Tax=Meridianimarinicoccus zhengii TaxID=2056810 RepID=UPI000DAC184A|nr:peptidylprolyl isomerase [Phycocomes zhengii]